MKINRNSSTASYVQIANYLRDAIRLGRYAPGARLPAESALVAQSACSRITVRQGLKLLEDEGLLERRQGIGTFVRKVIRQELSAVRTITEVMKSKGITPRVRVLGVGAVTPPAAVARAMQLKAQEQLLMIERLYQNEHEVIARLQTFLPLSLQGQVDALCQQDIQTDTTYTILERKLNIVLSGARQTIRAARADARDAACLGLELGAPVLVLDRVSHAADGQVVEYTMLHYHWERYEFSMFAPRLVPDSG